MAEEKFENEFNLNEYSDQQYEVNDVEEFIDTETGTIVDKEKLTPLDAIKAVAKKLGQIVKNPRSGCRKCYGRGYIGRDSKTKMPIPCNCIYDKEDLQKEEKMPTTLNRQQKRQYEKKMRKLQREYNKEVRKREQLKKEKEESDVTS